MLSEDIQSCSVFTLSIKKTLNKNKPPKLVASCNHILMSLCFEVDLCTEYDLAENLCFAYV